MKRKRLNIHICLYKNMQSFKMCLYGPVAHILKIFRWILNRGIRRCNWLLLYCKSTQMHWNWKTTVDVFRHIITYNIIHVLFWVSKFAYIVSWSLKCSGSGTNEDTHYSSSIMNIKCVCKLYVHVKCRNMHLYTFATYGTHHQSKLIFFLLQYIWIQLWLYSFSFNISEYSHNTLIFNSIQVQHVSIIH